MTSPSIHMGQELTESLDALDAGVVVVASRVSIGGTVASPRRANGGAVEVRIIVAVTLVVLASIAAWVIERRRPDAPAGSGGVVPHQLDRADFDRPDAPWLVVLFSSRTCESCTEVAAKIRPLECEEVAVQEAEYTERRDLHDRYRIDSVPMTVVADHQGVVQAAFIGKMTATDLWAAVAECRNPGASPEPELGQLPPSS